MVIFHETSELARAIGRPENAVRRAVTRGVIAPTARTARGTMLFSDEAVASAKERLANRRN